MKKKKQKPTAPMAKPIKKRHNKLTCLINDDEAHIVDSYLKKYKITNKSRWMRETLLAAIYKKIVLDDYPTLFNEHEMRR